MIVKVIAARTTESSFANISPGGVNQTLKTHELDSVYFPSRDLCAVVRVALFPAETSEAHTCAFACGLTAFTVTGRHGNRTSVGWALMVR